MSARICPECDEPVPAGMVRHYPACYRQSRYDDRGPYCRCAVCDTPMDPVLAGGGETTHPTCEERR